MNNDNNFQNMNNNGVPVQQPQGVSQSAMQQVPVVQAQMVQPQVVSQPVIQQVAAVQPQMVQQQTVSQPVMQEIPAAPYQNEFQVGTTEVVNTNPDIPAPAVAEVLDNTESVIPTASSEQVVLETAPKKSGGNLFLIIVVLLLILAVVYIDEVIMFVEENIISTNPTGVSDADSNNLVGGYILINDVTGSIKEHDIKFYNFKLYEDSFTLRFNYESLKDYKDMQNENVYIEVYNSDKQVLHKSLFFVEEGVVKDAVRTYSIILDADVYADAYYALVKVYTPDDLAKTSTLSCKYKMSNTGYNEVYKHDFNFKNDMLVSYSVDKSVEVVASSTGGTLALKELEKENQSLVDSGLTSTYSDGSLVYTIDLENSNSDYIPLYSKGTTSFIVKNKEVFKKWECE